MNLKRFLSIAACVLLACCAKLNAQDLQTKIANKQQLTNLPTIYLTVPDAIGQDINSVLKKTGNVAEYHAATIQVVDNTGKIGNFTDSKLEIKVRGNSTSQDGKRPYRLKFAKDVKDAAGNVIETHKHDMLGLGYKKRNWTLLTNHKDKSLLHNALTYHVGKAVGMPFCPGYQFVDLVINGEYRGNYQLSDHCEVGKNRIDVDEDTGWFIEAARQDMVEEPKVIVAGLGITIKNPEPDNDVDLATLKTSITDYFTKLNHFWGIYSTPCSMEEFVNAKTGWRAYIDEESLVNFYVGINLTDDYDGFMTVKMYREADGKLMFGPLWDKDLAYGNWQNHGKLCEEYQTGYTFCDHMARMMTDPYFVKKVHDKLHAVVNAGFVANMQKKIEEMGETIKESQKLNQSKWWTCDDYPAARNEFASYIEEHTKFFVGAIDKKYSDMGCDNLPVQPGLGGTTEGPEDEPSAGNTDTHTCPYETKLGEWQNIPLPSSAIHPRATAAHLKVTGTSFFRLLTTNDENIYISQYSFDYNGANMSGREFDITDEETLKMAKAGTLYLRCGGGSGTVTITCTVPETTDPDDDGTTNPDEGNDPEPVHAQLTNLPTIYLSAETIAGEWQQAAVEVFDKDEVFGHGTEWKKEGLSKKSNFVVSVQYQGSGKEGSKNSYRLKFNDKIDLLTAGDYKQWVLSSNDDDPTMINNALAKELGDGLGLPFTPGYQFVDLYVNETYMGTYQLTDRIKAEDGRALVSGGNKDLDWHVRFNDKTEIKENELQQWQYIASDKEIPFVIPKNPDPDDLAADAIQTLKSDMATYFQSLFAKDDKGHYTALANGVDQQQLFQWYIAQEILCVYKGFSSIEAYRSVTETAADQKLHIGVLWDSEKGFGNTGEKHIIDMDDLNTPGSNKGLMTEFAAYTVMKNLFVDLWQQPWFAEGVKALWDEKQAALLSDLTAKANSISATLYDSQAKNAEVWSEKSPATTEAYQQSVGKLTSYLDTRFKYLDKKFAYLAGVTILDVPTMVNYILGIGTATEGYKLADLNGDHVVDTQDLVILINAKNLK